MTAHRAAHGVHPWQQPGEFLKTEPCALTPASCSIYVLYQDVFGGASQT